MSIDTITHRRRPQPAASLDGRLLQPGRDGFDDARRAWNLAVDQRPAAVALAASEGDVAEAIAWARRSGLRVAPQGTGHGAAALGPLEDTLLLRTTGLRELRIDPRSCTARIGAGVVWQEAVGAAAEHGLATLAGSAPDVGVVGYALGGGFSWLARAHGLAAESLVAVELVTADGRLVRADAEHDADLFWALRGGGGSFGVVTAVELRLLPISEVYAGALWWPIDRGEEVLGAWRELTSLRMPDELTTVARYLRLPPLPEVPEPLRGRAFVVVEACHLGEPERADALLAPLRGLGPENDTFELMGVEELARLHMDPPQPVPALGDGVLLSELPSEAVDTLVRLAGVDVESPLLSVEVRQLGGELARLRPGHGALGAVRSPYALYAVGIAATSQGADAVGGALGQLGSALAPWTSTEACLNFAETGRDPVTLWGESVHRLREIKARVDPEGLIRSNHPVTSA